MSHNVICCSWIHCISGNIICSQRHIRYKLDMCLILVTRDREWPYNTILQYSTYPKQLQVSRYYCTHIVEECILAILTSYIRMIWYSYLWMYKAGVCCHYSSSQWITEWWDEVLRTMTSTMEEMLIVTDMQNFKNS